jgi:hypothetical protein
LSSTSAGRSTPKRITAFCAASASWRVQGATQRPSLGSTSSAARAAGRAWGLGVLVSDLDSFEVEVEKEKQAGNN